MCGIAGIIYKDGTHPVGAEMTRMLQSMKHRGPDSTGYALYGAPENGSLVMRYKLADANTPRDFGFAERLRLHRREVEARLARLGADVHEVEEETPYAFRVSFDYGGDLKLLADLVEDIPEAEVLSLGRSLEIVKDLGDAETVGGQYGLASFTGTHAIGRIDMIENRTAGDKSREIYEAPAAVVLHTAHRELQAFVTPCDLERLTSELGVQYADLVYKGLWYTPTRQAIDALVTHVQQRVTGVIRMRFFKGECAVVGRQSPFADVRAANQAAAKMPGEKKGR